MNSGNCDFSPMRQQLIAGLLEIKSGIEHSLNILGNENECLLGTLEDTKKRFSHIEALAASFYLNCYLSEYTDKYFDLSVTIQHLSRKRHGALIVVERQDPVEHFIQKGTQIGANLTPPLLESIFYPGNPLHDGAVLIRTDFIVSAANVLPLATEIISEKKLGTRHRAAIGLSERSDALVLVVSEETGKASFAIDGKLYPVASGSLY